MAVKCVAWLRRICVRSLPRDGGAVHKKPKGLKSIITNNHYAITRFCLESSRKCRIIKCVAFSALHSEN